MMRHPERWPQLVLPLVKRPLDWKQTDHFALFRYPSWIARGHFLFEDWQKLKWEKATPEEILAEGWRVD